MNLVEAYNLICQECLGVQKFVPSPKHILPETIFIYFEEQQIPYVRKNISQWQQFETGTTEFSYDDFLFHFFKITPQPNLSFLMLTDDHFRDLSLPLLFFNLQNYVQCFEDFEKHALTNWGNFSLFQPFDHFLLSSKGDLWILHHEGDVFRYKIDQKIANKFFSC